MKVKWLATESILSVMALLSNSCGVLCNMSWTNGPHLSTCI